MSLEIRIMNLGDIQVDSSFLVSADNPGKIKTVPCYAYLILGGEKPILVDAGFRFPEIMERMGLKGTQTEDQTIENQLAKHGLKPEDIGYVILTHLHIDHAGLVYKFPNAVAVVQRREMEGAFSGLMTAQYAKEDLEHMFERLYTPGSLWLLDGDITGPISIIPGVKCVFSHSHTLGLQHVYVELDSGTAVMCADTLYQIDLSTKTFREQFGEYQPTGNHACSTREEIASIAKLVNDADYILNAHDYKVQEVYGDRLK